MSLDTTIQAADREFRKECKDLECEPWDINPLAKSPYLTGVTTAWPSLDLQTVVERQIPILVEAATSIARKHRLISLYEYPIFAAGGAVVVYFGWAENQHQ
ncbi:hypothetical protein J4208_03520 [Candidatus Woesearchaeota archaeon]|nr:hypothetical protein [Candidatus Woesearchaeota archaeon]